MSMIGEEVGGTVAVPLKAVRMEGAEQAPNWGARVTDTLKRAAVGVSERIYELSDGRYGLEPAHTPTEKKAAKRPPRPMRQAAKQGKAGARSSGLVWTIGVSVGLLFGLVGVAYWQRRRLRRLWAEASERVQQATEEMRQRLEAQRATPAAYWRWREPAEARDTARPKPSPASAATPSSLDAPAPLDELGRQSNGRVESSMQ